MTNEQIYSYVDHTALKAVCTWEDIKVLCEESLAYKTASVCVPPYYISQIKESFPSVNICTVIGFPLGYNTTVVKVFETKKAIKDGANEIDMVVNIAAVKNKSFDYVKNEIEEIKKACGDKILKVIIEACYLTQEEKIQLCNIIGETGADYIKTSTGFGTGGATPEDIILFKEHISPDLKMKAAGGIQNRGDMVNYIELDCSRLGTSSAIKILEAT